MAMILFISCAFASLDELQNIDLTDGHAFLGGVYNNLKSKDTNGAIMHVTDLTQEITDQSCAFYKQRQGENFFGTTVVVDLNTPHAENKDIADAIKEFRKELEAVKGSEEIFDFQEYPHLTVAAVVMDRHGAVTEQNLLFASRTTNREEIKKTMKKIEDAGVVLKVEEAKSLQFTNANGQFSIQFDARGQVAKRPFEMTEDERNACKQRMKDDLENRITNDNRQNDRKNFDNRFANNAKNFDNYDKLTPFQKARFELIANAGADVKDHYPAMALHIGQIKNPCKLVDMTKDNPPELIQINAIWAKYKKIFAQKKIVFKGLKYVQYTSNSLDPRHIRVLEENRRRI